MQYAARLPIGLESIIRNVPAETIKAFYQKWYTAENMAVILMGDLSDLEGTLELVKQHLGSVPSNSTGISNKPERYKYFAVLIHMKLQYTWNSTILPCAAEQQELVMA